MVRLFLGSDPTEDDSPDVLASLGLVQVKGPYELTPLGRWIGRQVLAEAAGQEVPVMGSLAGQDAAALLHGLRSYPQDEQYVEIGPAGLLDSCRSCSSCGYERRPCSSAPASWPAREPMTGTSCPTASPITSRPSTGRAGSARAAPSHVADRGWQARRGIVVGRVAAEEQADHLHEQRLLGGEQRRQASDQSTG